MPFWKFLPNPSHVTKSKNTEIEENLLFDRSRTIKLIGIKSYLAHLYFCLQSNTLNRIRKIKARALVIYKEEDLFFNKETFELLKKKTFSFHHKKIAGKGHLFLNRDKNKISKAISNFLRSEGAIISLKDIKERGHD